MIRFLWQVVALAELWWLLWWGPKLLMGARGRRRMYRQLARRASAGVQWVLTWPRRRQAARYAREIALRIQLREQYPRYTELMIGTDMRVTALHPEGFEPGIRPPEPQPSIFTSQDALVQLAAGRPPTVAGPEQWAPARTAAMPTGRCNACPEWGCPVQGGNPECSVHAYRPGCGCERCSDVVSYEEVTTHDQVEPVAYIPTGRASDRGRAVFDRQASNPEHLTEARRMIEETRRQHREWDDKLAAALAEARQPRPGDDEIAKPPRDEFDAHIPPIDPGVDRLPRRVRPPGKRLAASLPCPFCGEPPILGGGGVWREVHGKRCTLRRRDHRRRPSGAQRRKLRDRVKDAIDAARRQLVKEMGEDVGQVQRDKYRAVRVDNSRTCGACDKPATVYGDGPKILHEVGCPRRSWSFDRAILPRPGRAPRRGPHVVAPCPSCDRPYHAPAGECRDHRPRDEGTGAFEHHA